MAYKRTAYHSVNPVWRTKKHAPSGYHIGIELEISHRQGYQRILENLPEPPKGHAQPITEFDSSLTARTDIEIVFPPYKHSTIKNGRSFLNKALTALREAGCQSTTETGMHVNINTTGWSARTVALFVATIHALPPHVLASVGGRLLNRYCKQLTLEDSFNPETNGTYLDINAVVRRSKRSHNTAVSVRNNRVELRFPAATTDITRVRTIVDFAVYVEKFANSLPRRVVRTGSLQGQLGDVGQAFHKFLEQEKRTKAVKTLLVHTKPRS